VSHNITEDNLQLPFTGLGAYLNLSLAFTQLGDFIYFAAYEDAVQKGFYFGGTSGFTFICDTIIVLTRDSWNCYDFDGNFFCSPDFILRPLIPPLPFFQTRCQVEKEAS